MTNREPPNIANLRPLSIYQHKRAWWYLDDHGVMTYGPFKSSDDARSDMKWRFPETKRSRRSFLA